MIDTLEDVEKYTGTDRIGYVLINKGVLRDLQTRSGEIAMLESEVATMRKEVATVKEQRDDALTSIMSIARKLSCDPSEEIIHQTIDARTVARATQIERIKALTRAIADIAAASGLSPDAEVDQIIRTVRQVIVDRKNQGDTIVSQASIIRERDNKRHAENLAHTRWASGMRAVLADREKQIETLMNIPPESRPTVPSSALDRLLVIEGAVVEIANTLRMRDDARDDA